MWVEITFLPTFLMITSPIDSYRATKNWGMGLWPPLLPTPMFITFYYLGMLPMEVQALLKHLILEQNYLSLDELNHFIMYIELGYMETKNRPTTINLKDMKLVQSG